MTTNLCQKQILISLIIFVILSLEAMDSYSQINQNYQEEIGSLINFLVIPNKTTITPRERIEVTIIVDNQSSKPISNIKIEYIENPIFKLKNEMNFPDIVDKYSTQKGNCYFETVGKGKSNLVLALLYRWKDDSGNVHSPLTVASTKELEVHSWYSDWVGEKLFFILAGAVLTLVSGLISSIFTLKCKTRLEREKREEEEKKSKKEDEKRVISVLLSMLHTNKKLIKQKNLTIRGWDSIYYKEGFYSALYRISGAIKERDLPSLISDLYILLSDYDERLKENEQLITEVFQKELTAKIDIVTKSLEGLLGKSQYV